jgi:hypothetical protein
MMSGRRHFVLSTAVLVTGGVLLTSFFADCALAEGWTNANSPVTTCFLQALALRASGEVRYRLCRVYARMCSRRKKGSFSSRIAMLWPGPMTFGLSARTMDPRPRGSCTPAAEHMHPAR